MTAVTTMTAFSLYSESIVICVIAVISCKIDELFYPIHFVFEAKSAVLLRRFSLARNIQFNLPLCCL